MKFIDVTLRDGGHQHGFNWPLEFIERYFKSINLFPEIEFVELGYWKQSDINLMDHFTQWKKIYFLQYVR